MTYLEQKGGKEGEILCNLLQHQEYGKCFLIDWNRKQLEFSFATGWSVKYNSAGNLLVDYNKVNPLSLLCPGSSAPRYSPERDKNRCTCT